MHWRVVLVSRIPNSDSQVVYRDDGTCVGKNGEVFVGNALLPPVLVFNGASNGRPSTPIDPCASNSSSRDSDFSGRKKATNLIV